MRRSVTNSGNQKPETRNQNRRAGGLLVSGFWFLVCCSSQQPPPPVPETTVETSPQELSTIVVPIRSTLAPLLPLIESQVMKSAASKGGGYENVPKQPYAVRYRIARDPIALNMEGSGLHATTTVHYSLEGCRITQKPFSNETTLFPCLSCGFDEPMRDAWIALDAHVEWDENWRLRTRTKARLVEFGKRCTVTFMNLDVTDWKLAPVINEQMQQVAKTIDANTPKLTSIRPSAQQIWSALQTPTEIAPRTWLVMEPLDVALAPITGRGLDVASALSLRTRTRIVVGERPPVAAKALPPLRVARDASTGVRVPFDVELSWEEASRLLTENFGGKRYQNVAVESLRLLAGKEGKIVVEAAVDYRGGALKKYHGLVYLEGTPRFDAATRALALENLDYSLDPKRHNPFVRIGDRLAHDALRARLAQTATWSLAPQIAAVKTEIERATTRPLAQGIAMHGRVTSIEPRSVVARAEGLTIRVVATGEASVEVAAWR
jgi:hypothetical protein